MKVSISSSGSRRMLKAGAACLGAVALLFLGAECVMHWQAAPAPAEPQAKGSAQAEAPAKPWSNLPLLFGQRPPDDPKPEAQSNQRLAEGWFAAVSNYNEEDRGTVLDEMVEDMLARGPAIVGPLASYLKGTSLYDHVRRAAAFHVLGRIPGDIASSTSPEAVEARATLHRLAEEELKLPGLMPVDPALKLDMLSENERHALIHDGSLIEKDGQFYQSSGLNKLAAIRLLSSLGDSESLGQLQTLAKAEDNPVGLQFAVARAIELASR